MLTRILVVLAAGSLIVATAHAQTSSSGSSTSSPSTTSPSTTSPSTTSPSTGSSSSTTGSGGSSSTTSPSQAQSMGSFDITKYKTKTECMNAAGTDQAHRDACNKSVLK